MGSQPSTKMHDIENKCRQILAATSDSDKKLFTQSECTWVNCLENSIDMPLFQGQFNFPHSMTTINNLTKLGFQCWHSIPPNTLYIIPRNTYHFVFNTNSEVTQSLAFDTFLQAYEPK
jgi:hypothetical protein